MGEWQTLADYPPVPVLETQPETAVPKEDQGVLFLQGFLLAHADKLATRITNGARLVQFHEVAPDKSVNERDMVERAFYDREPLEARLQRLMSGKYCILKASVIAFTANDDGYTATLAGPATDFE